jgi:hypothetical protein
VEESSLYESEVYVFSFTTVSPEKYTIKPLLCSPLLSFALLCSHLSFPSLSFSFSSPHTLVKIVFHGTKYGPCATNSRIGCLYKLRAIVLDDKRVVVGDAHVELEVGVVDHLPPALACNNKKIKIKIKLKIKIKIKIKLKIKIKIKITLMVHLY